MKIVCVAAIEALGIIGARATVSELWDWKRGERIADVLELAVSARVAAR
jgi:hypothetical protein